MQFKSLVPLSLTVFPRVGSRNRCSRLKTLCKASLTLTSDITKIYRQARASCSCASFEPVPEIVHEPAPGSTGGHNADPDGETHAFPFPLRLLYPGVLVPRHLQRSQSVLHQEPRPLKVCDVTLERIYTMS